MRKLNYKMSPSVNGVYTLIFTLILSISLEVSAQSTWQEMAEELPLPPGQWVETPAYKLKKAKLVWINREYFEKLGINIPEKITPQLNSWAVDTFAYGVPSPSDSKTDFDLNQKMIAGADRYGGVAIGTNVGSGRAITFFAKVSGMEFPLVVQSKGAGKTELVMETGKDHSNGKAHLGEGMKEALYSKINNAELPLGGNEVIAIIDRGTDSTNSHNELGEDCLIIREFPIRPAHFLKLRGVKKQPGKIREYLLKVLPGFGDDLVERLTLYAENIAEQYGAAFALRLFHGAPSESNIEISGRWLDFGTESATHGYGQMKVLEDAASNGNFRVVEIDMLNGFLVGLGQRSNGEVKLTDGEFERIEKRFKRKLKNTLDITFLKLTGLPEDIVKRLLLTDEGKNLAKKIRVLATEGAIKYSGKYELPEKTTKFDVNTLLIKLGSMPFATSDKLRKQAMADFPKDRAIEFSESYAKVMALANSFSEAKNLMPVIKENSENLNKDLSPIYRSNVFAPIDAAIEKYLWTKDSNIIQDQVNALIKSGSRNSRGNSCQRLF